MIKFGNFSFLRALLEKMEKNDVLNTCTTQMLDIEFQLETTIFFSFKTIKVNSNAKVVVFIPEIHFCYLLKIVEIVSFSNICLGTCRL